MSRDPRTIVSVHAHPDDEASKGAATIAKYAQLGVRAVLVTATGGEEGEYLNPAFKERDPGELPELRMKELARSAEIIGYEQVELLGFRDSGMPGSEANGHVNCFGAVSLETAVRPLVAILRRERPQVMISYGERQDGYPHPDHLRVYEVAKVARDWAGDPDFAPELGPAHRVAKWYWSLWVRARFEALGKAIAAKGIELPFRMTERAGDDDLVTTRIDVRETIGVGPRALLAHETQVDPNSPFWFALSPEELADVYPYEEYHLVGAPEGYSEQDLFAGLEGD
ncbi:MAG: PIG-L family deacetylase [Ferrimicrobium sp.]|uniref:PIG-L family deacetylase n=1 Tax=Ferrimicrobium sp. TaxID=2926050 RepID=UPI00261013B6|nr:PIG-L family deacetylase [Ferrimicrobium sp.]